MSSRHLLLVVAVAASAALVPVGSGVSHADQTAPSTATTLGGWSGTDPVPVGVGETSDDALTAAFTTVPLGESPGVAIGRDLWVADKLEGGDWGTPVRIATDVAPGAKLAENDTGAAVLAWDKATPDGGSVLTASTRAASGEPWSTPTALVADARSNHEPALGIDDAGAATVAYVEAGDPSVATRQFADGAWSDPLVHSTAPVKQVMMSVSSTGFGTVAWTQVEGGAEQIYTQRLLPSHGWDHSVSVQNTGDYEPDPQLVMLALATADDGHAALTAAYTDASARGLWWASNLQSYNEGPPPIEAWLSDDECDPSCTIKWYGRQNGGNRNGITPQAAVADMTSEPWDTVLDIRSEQDGDPSHWVISALASNGTEWGRGVLLSAPGGDNVDPAVVQRGYRALISWIRRESGDSGPGVLQVRAVSAGFDDHVMPDPVLTTLGPVSGTPVTVMSATGDTAVVWADPTTPSALRSATFTANAIVAPDQEFSPDDRVPVSWSSTGPSTVRYDVRVRQARVSAGLGRYRTWKSGTRQKAAAYPAVAGRTVCFSTRARGAAGRTSSWSPAQCTVVPVNDSALSGHGWRRQVVARAYGGEVRTASHAGRSMSLSRVTARTIGLLVARGPHTGAVRVRLGSRTLGTFSTRGHRRVRAVIEVAHLARARTGRLRLTTTSSRPVRVDGVFISSR